MQYYDPTGLGVASGVDQGDVSEHFLGITAFDAATAFRMEARFSSALRDRGVLFANLEREITSEGRSLARNLAAGVDHSLTEVLGAIGRFSATVEEAEARLRMHISERQPVSSGTLPSEASVGVAAPEPRWADQADEEEEVQVEEEEEEEEPPADSGMDLEDLGEPASDSMAQQFAEAASELLEQAEAEEVMEEEEEELGEREEVEVGSADQSESRDSDMTSSQEPQEEPTSAPQPAASSVPQPSAQLVDPNVADSELWQSLGAGPRSAAVAPTAVAKSSVPRPSVSVARQASAASAQPALADLPARPLPSNASAAARPFAPPGWNMDFSEPPDNPWATGQATRALRLAPPVEPSSKGKPSGVAFFGDFGSSGSSGKGKGKDKGPQVPDSDNPCSAKYAHCEMMLGNPSGFKFVIQDLGEFSTQRSVEALAHP